MSKMGVFIRLTAIAWDGSAHRASTQTIPGHGEFWWYSDERLDARHCESVFVHDEGVTWIRGYHELESEAVHAMKAAKAMAVRR